MSSRRVCEVEHLVGIGLREKLASQTGNVVDLYNHVPRHLTLDARIEHDVVRRLQSRVDGAVEGSPVLRDRRERHSR